MASIQSAVTVFHTVTAVTIPSLDTDSMILWIRQRNSLRSGKVQDNLIGITFGEGGDQIKAITFISLTQTDGFIAQVFPAIDKPRLQGEVNGISKTFQQFLGHHLVLHHWNTVNNFLRHIPKDIHTDRSGGAAGVTEEPGRRGFLCPEDQNIIPSGSGVIPFLPLRLRQHSSIRDEAILGQIIEEYPHGFITVFARKGEDSIQIHDTVFVVSVRKFNVQLCSGIGIQQAFDVHCLKHSFGCLKFNQFTPKRQIVFVQDLIQLVLHFLGIQVIAIILVTKIRDVSPN